jgi:hypothetical protein
MKGVLSWLVRWACRASDRDFCPALAALVGSVQNIFSPPYTILIHLSPLPRKLGRQLCWLASLLLCVSAHTPWEKIATCLPPPPDPLSFLLPLFHLPLAPPFFSRMGSLKQQTLKDTGKSVKLGKFSLFSYLLTS